MQKRNLLLSSLLLPAPALGAGTTLPDMGQSMLFKLLLGFCVVLFIWIAHRLTPHWRNKLKTISALGKLGTFNTAAVSITIAVTLLCLAVQSFFILIIGFVAIPILGVAILVELIWGWSTSKPSE